MPSLRRSLFLLLALLAVAPVRSLGAAPQHLAADSLLERVYSYTQRGGLYVGLFQADAYAKFHVRTVCRNVAMRMVPHAFRLEHGVHSYVGEGLSSFTYTDLGRIDYRERAFFCTMPHFRSMRNAVISNVVPLIYKENFLNDRILSPFNRHNARCYHFCVDSVGGEGPNAGYGIEVSPRMAHPQLVSGRFVMTAEGRVLWFDFRFRHDRFLSVRVEALMGQAGLESLLAHTIKVNADYLFLGNRVNFDLTALLRYSRIDSTSYVGTLNRRTRPDYCIDDAGARLAADTLPTLHGAAAFDSLRPWPLSPSEHLAYARYAEQSRLKQQARAKSEAEGSKASEIIENVLLDSHNFYFAGARLRLPALITPSMVQWSGSKGFSLRTKLKLRSQTTEGRAFSLTPDAGYNFKLRQFYWNVPLDYLFCPKLGGGFKAAVGNGNRIYNSEQARDVRNRLRGVANYDSLVHILHHYDFNYYRDFYARGAFYLEPRVGLKFTIGGIYHCRTQIEAGPQPVSEGTRRQYKSFAPYLDVSFTPALYYYPVGQRRVPYYSAWPTFSAMFERGIQALGCDNRYDRFEFDVQYARPLTALRKLFLRSAFGFYTNSEHVYFVDYKNFSYQSLPEDVEDELAGHFQLLNRTWYNESNYYAFLSSAYQSPMLLASRIPLLARVVKNERLYLNFLFVNALHPYTELGYGFSTSVVNVAGYAGLANLSGFRVGVKLGITLFDDL